MSTIHVQAKTDASGNLTLSRIDVGMPNTDVDVTVQVQPRVDAETWRQRLREVLRQAQGIELERYPQEPISDPWEE